MWAYFFRLPTFLLIKFIRQIIGVSFSCSNSALSIFCDADKKVIFAQILIWHKMKGWFVSYKYFFQSWKPSFSRLERNQLNFPFEALGSQIKQNIFIFLHVWGIYGMMKIKDMISPHLLDPLVRWHQIESTWPLNSSSFQGWNNVIYQSCLTGILDW